MKNSERCVLLCIFCFGAVVLHPTDALCAEDENVIRNGNVTIVGRIPDTEREAVKTVRDGDIVTVGKRSENATMSTFLQTVPTVVTLMVDPSDAYRVVESDMVEILKPYEFIKKAKWDKKKCAIILEIDNRKISTESAGREAVRALRSKFNIRFLEGSVRR